MPEISISTYAGRKDPEASARISAYNRSSNLAQAKPTTGEVIGSYVEETFEGAGSLSQDIQARNIRRSQEQGTAFSKPTISEDDWKQSSDYRDGLTYHPSMTAYESKILAERYDDRINNQIIQDKASGLQSAAGMGVGFLSGVVEPKNLASGVAAAIVTGGVGAVVPSVGRLIAVNSVKAAAGRGVVEGVVGAALTEPSNLSSAKQLQDDYTFADSMMNLALGSVLGAGLGAGGKVLELRAEGKQKAIVEAYQAERHLAVKEMDTALAQTVQGAPIDVASVKQLDNAEVSQRARQELPRIEERIAAQEAATGFKAIDIPDLATVGTNWKDMQAGQLYYQEPFTNWNFRPNQQGGAESTRLRIYETQKNGSSISQGVAGEAVVYKNTDGTIELSDIKVSEEQRRKGLATNLVDRIFEEFPNVKEIKTTGFTENGLAFARGSYEIKDGTILLKPERVKLKERKAQAESNARIQTDNAPIKKLQDDLAKPDNSTAYNPTDSLDIQKYLDDAGELEDQIRIEQQLESMAEEIAELRSQGLLNDAELGILENLSNIDKESAIFDNVLLNAKICLTRG